VRILILGGTAEARQLARRLEGDARFSPLTSLAGVTDRPAEIAGDIRTGGFGGVEGLMDFIAKERIALMVDAAHPFAVKISANAAQASTQTGIGCLRFERPPWQEQPGDYWTHVKDIENAVQAIPEDARVLVTIGRQKIAAFFSRPDIHVIARMIEKFSSPVPGNAEIFLARPPFTLEQEYALLEEKGITVLVTRNSGGNATFAKIGAARELGIPVIMITRPQKAEVTTLASIEALLENIEAELS